MLITLLIVLLLSSALTFRGDKSVLYSRVVALSLLSASYIAFNNLFIEPLRKGIGIYGGLLNVTSFTLIFNIFTFTIIAVIAAWAASLPRKQHAKAHSNLRDSIYTSNYSNYITYNNIMCNKTVISPNVVHFVSIWHKWRSIFNITVQIILSILHSLHKYTGSLYITSITIVSRFMPKQWFKIVNILTNLKANLRSFFNRSHSILLYNRCKKVFLGILRVTLYAVVIIVFLVLLYLLFKHVFMYGDIYTCTDDIPSRIANCQEKLAYFNQELRGCRYNFTQSIRYGDSLEEQEQCRVAMVEAQNNVNAELRMLNILRNAQNMGHTEVVVNSTLGKRGNSD